MTSNAAFTLNHPSEVLTILDRLHRERALTTVEFGDGHAIVSTVLDVRRDAKTMLFDIARDAESNERLFAARQLRFVSELDHVQIAFETATPSRVVRGDGPAASVDLPATVLRLQRRESFRAALPVDPPVRCTLSAGDGRASSARAIDLSCGGAAVVVDDPSLRSATPGTDHDLVLAIPDVGSVAVRANLRTVLPGATPSRVRLGFRFDDVPAKTAAQIQRYVQQVEVKQLRLLKRRG